MRCIKRVLALLPLFLCVSLFNAGAQENLSSNNMTRFSSLWECNFPVDRSGMNPEGNFYNCRADGCGSEIYKYYDAPETYTEIKDFQVNFKQRLISYKQTLKHSARSKMKVNYSTESTSSSFNTVSVSNLHEYGKGKDQVVSIAFETCLEPFEGSPLELIDPKPELYSLSSGFRMNTVVFFDGGTKVVWQYLTPFNYEKKSMYVVSAFGECRPVLQEESSQQK